MTRQGCFLLSMILEITFPRQKVIMLMEKVMEVWLRFHAKIFQGACK